MLAVLPWVLQCITASSTAVRCSALAAAADIISAMGTALLPAVPSMLPAVFSSLTAAVQRLPDESSPVAHTDTEADVGAEENEVLGLEGQAADEQAPATAALQAMSPAGPATPAGKKRKKRKSAAVQGGDNQGTGAGSTEVTAALGAVAALLGSPLGAYAAPSIAALLSALLSKRLQACGAPAVAAAVDRVQQQVPAVVPARLLLPALTAQLLPALEVSMLLQHCAESYAAALQHEMLKGQGLPLTHPCQCQHDDAGSIRSTHGPYQAAQHALPVLVQEGPASLSAHLQILTASLQQAPASSVAANADSLFGMLLRALDARQRLSSPNTAPLPAESMPSIEAGSLAALLALVLKLSEARFKPLFLRMLDWAASPPAATPGVCCGLLLLC